MPAIGHGKRSFLEEQQLSSPAAASSPNKRLRCSSSPARRSPPRGLHLPPLSSYSSSPLAHLASLFPSKDKQLLERALEESGNDLDSAIRSLNELCLGSAENSGAVVDKGATLEEAVNPTPFEGSEASVACEDQPLSLGGSEWVELFVREVMFASDLDDARGRAARIFLVLEKSIQARGGAEVAESLQKENLMLREQVETLLKDNVILKRAVAIQHERQKESDDKTQELQHLRQLVSQYQEQLRTLEVNNYALMMHLRQAQQNSSIPGRFHPDVF